MRVFDLGSVGRSAKVARLERRDWRPSGIELLEGRALLSASPNAASSHGVAASATVSTSLASAAMGGVKALMNVVYTNIGGPAEHLDLYLPTGSPPPGGFPVILALPGGGWRWVRRNDLGVTVSELAKYGYVVAVADYAYASPKPGSHIWPTNIEDVRQAVRWLKTNAGRFQIDPGKVAVWGESAGGNMANLLGTDPDGPLLALNGKLTGATRPGQVSASVQAVIDFYGPTDLTTLYQEAPKDDPFLDTFLGGPPSKYPAQYQDASPVDHVTSSSPPFLIYQGTADAANAPAQAAELDQALTKAGVAHQISYFQGVPHGFRLQPLPNVNLLPQILAFLNTALNQG